jgi:hypothetical protein
VNSEEPVQLELGVSIDVHRTFDEPVRSEGDIWVITRLKNILIHTAVASVASAFARGSIYGYFPARLAGVAVDPDVTLRKPEGAMNSVKDITKCEVDRRCSWVQEDMNRLRRSRRCYKDDDA